MASGSERAIVFDDGRGRLWPLTDTRAAFDVRTGAVTTLERWTRVLAAGGVALAGVCVPRELAGVTGAAHGTPLGDEAPLRVNDGGVLRDGPVLAVSGRWVIAREDELERARALKLGEALVSTAGSVLAARLEGGALRLLVEEGTLAAGCRRLAIEGAAILERAWDVVRHRNVALNADLDAMLGSQPASPTTRDVATVLAPERVRIADDARLFPGVVIDAESGPVVIGKGAVIRPNAVICGPAFIGPRSTVLDGAVIRPNTVIGPVCKVNGEISGAIFQGHSNKAHDGFLGDSYIGAWANLGAGTITSNLLNTYSEISATPALDEPRERTGLTFFGAIIGDHAKTAIGTRLMTGSIIGTGAMVAVSPPPACVGNFAWLAEGRSQLYRLSKFLGVCETVMERRGVALSDADRARLRALHDAVTRTLIAAPHDYQI